MKKLVFDSKEWSKTGDIGDNSQFWKPALILNRGAENTAVVLFDDGTVSAGHFVSSMKEIPPVYESSKERVLEEIDESNLDNRRQRLSTTNDRTVDL